MDFSPRIALLALLLLVLPAAVTVLFLSRQAHRAVTAGAQPGGTLAGRLEPRGGAAPSASVEGADVEIAGVAIDGSSRVLARGTTDANGRFALAVEPYQGTYEVRVRGGVWQPSAVPASLLDSAGAEVLVPVHPGARLELGFARRSKSAVRGGDWTLDGEVGRSWFSAWGGSRFERSGSFTGPELVVEGLPPMRARIVVRLDGGDRTELVIDLAVGPNRHTVEF
ncbi:MAG: hypothetical protein NTY35_07255 [Planctomycetota bacterium]|nr:hypothetical protein [Planctomycetota bacterium]